jgi:serine/threonine-protein kinase
LFAGVVLGLFFVPWSRLLPLWAETASSITGSGARPYQLALDAAALIDRYDRAGNVDRAIELLQQATAVDPQYATAYAYLAFAYLARNVSSPDAQWMTFARANVDRALELNADLALAHVATGALHQNSARPDEARAAYERALQLDPLSARALRGLARIHDAANREDAAREGFAKAIAADPDDWQTHQDLGAFHYRRGHYAEAAAAFESARGLTPDNVSVLQSLSGAQYMAGHADEAASTLQQALAIRPTGPIYTNLANIRFFQGRYADATDAFEKAVKLNATNSLVWGNLGDAYRWAPGRAASAPDAYKRAIQLLDEQLVSKPADPNLRTRRALYVSKMGDARAGIEELRSLPGTQALTPQMLVRVATVHELAGNRAGALDALARALKAGYPPREIAVDPEFIGLRSDERYQRLIAAFTPASSR